MDQSNEDFVLQVIEQAHDMTLATVRDDGYPQATTVTYAHDGLTLYVGIGKYSQKARNIQRDNRVSLTINLPYQRWNDIRGLSMCARAELLDQPDDIARAQDCLMERFPQVSEWGGPDMSKEVAFLRIRPEMISVIDYTKGFGHTELVSTGAA
jgi:general stress protein 26